MRIISKKNLLIASSFFLLGLLTNDLAGVVWETTLLNDYSQGIIRAGAKNNEAGRKLYLNCVAQKEIAEKSILKPECINRELLIKYGELKRENEMLIKEKLITEQNFINTVNKH